MASTTGRVQPTTVTTYYPLVLLEGFNYHKLVGNWLLS